MSIKQHIRALSPGRPRREPRHTALDYYLLMRGQAGAAAIRG